MQTVKIKCIQDVKDLDEGDLFFKEGKTYLAKEAPLNDKVYLGVDYGDEKRSPMHYVGIVSSNESGAVSGIFTPESSKLGTWFDEHFVVVENTTNKGGEENVG